MSSQAVLHILQDSGAPTGSTDYTTLVLIHGYAWNSGIFIKLLPLAQTYNTRVVLVNRRDYPGAIPYTPDERTALEEAAALVQAGGDSDLSEAREKFEAFFDDRGREVYDLLLTFVKDNDIPVARPAENTGGIVLAGWSYASVWMNAFLANALSFPADDIDLSLYVRRIICHDAPYEMLGYTPPDADPYTPLFDNSIPPTEMISVFSHWVSGYFRHGPPESETDEAVCDPAYFSRRTSLADPPTTLSTLTPSERAATTYPPPGEQPSGSDYLLLGAFPAGAFAALRKRALALPPAKLFKREHGGLDPEPEMKTKEEAWRGVELRMVWCDRSIWSMPWAIACMKKDLSEAKAAGRPLRKVSFLRMRGSNHFVHWDEPERAMDAFLAAKGDAADWDVGAKYVST